MVTDTFDIRAGVQKTCVTCRQAFAHFRGAHLRQIVGNISFQRIDNRLVLQNIFYLIGIKALNSLHAQAYIFACQFAHTHNLFDSKADSDGGSVQHVFVKINRAHGDDFCLARHNLFYQLDERVDKGHKEQCVENVERRVCIRNLTRYVAVRRYKQHEFNEERHKDYKNYTADDVEHYVSCSYTLSCKVSTQRSEYGSNTGTDVVAEQYRNRAFQRNKALTGHGDKNTDGSTAGLNQYSHNHTDTDAQQRIAGENLDEMHKAGIVTQRHNSFAHHIHAQHQNTEAQHNLAKIFCAAFSRQQLHQKADED